MGVGAGWGVSTEVQGWEGAAELRSALGSSPHPDSGLCPELLLPSADPHPPAPPTTGDLSKAQTVPVAISKVPARTAAGCEVADTNSQPTDQRPGAGALSDTCTFKLSSDSKPTSLSPGRLHGHLLTVLILLQNLQGWPTT